MRRTALQLQEVLGREPTDAEVAAKLGIAPTRVAQLRTAAIRPASLDAPLGDDEENSFADVVQDESESGTPYQHLEDKTVGHMLGGAMGGWAHFISLANILAGRFVLDGGVGKDAG
ncbi:MAG: sigma-70 domain-containing protein [Verrucomicrobiota bacterium]